MEVMLTNRVIPIMNENDTVCVTELMFTDNDELSGLTATMLKADILLILSNIDGLYNGDPSQEGTKLIPYVNPDENMDRYIVPSKSSAGRGGMESKCHTALNVSKKGIKVIIANGKRNDIITDTIAGTSGVPCTVFSK